MDEMGTIIVYKYKIMYMGIHNVIRNVLFIFYFRLWLSICMLVLKS